MAVTSEAYKVKPVQAPLSGINYRSAGTLIKDTEMTDCRNVYADRHNTIKKREGYRLFSDDLPLDGPVMAIDQFFTTDGLNYLMAMTQTSAYWYDTEEELWTDITEETGDPGEEVPVPFTGDDEHPFYMETMNDLMLVTNYIDPIKKWNGSGKMEELDNAPKAKFMRKYKTYLVLGHVESGGNAYPMRVQWSDTGDPETWTGGNSGHIDLMEGVDWIQWVDTLSDKIVVIKERSIYTGYLVNTADIFAFDLRVPGIGACASGGVVNLGDEIIFLGWDNVYAFNGITVEPIGDVIKDELFNLMSPSNLNKVHHLLVEEYDEIHFFVPTAESTWPEAEFVFNYVKRCWTRNTRNVPIISAGYYWRRTQSSWDNIEGTWNEQGARWNDRALLQSAPSNLLGDPDGNIYEWDYTLNTDEEEPYEAYFDTKDYTMDNWDQQNYYMRLDIVASGDFVDVYYSKDEGITWVLLEKVILESAWKTYKIDFRVSAEKIRFRFRNDEISTFAIRQYAIYYAGGGRLL
jgi:hypothetical protein